MMKILIVSTEITKRGEVVGAEMIMRNAFVFVVILRRRQRGLGELCGCDESGSVKWNQNQVITDKV